MTRPAKVSVVTVVLNDPEGFLRTRDSILSQGGDLEWIVVDGGSSDETPELIRTTGPSIAWWVSEPDGGIYEGMNKGILHCSGDFIIFMNAGDQFADSNVVKTLLSCLDELGSPDVVLGGTCQVIGNSQIWRHPKDIGWIGYGLPAFHQSTFYLRENLSRRNFDCRYRLLADYAWLASAATQGVNVASIDVPISRFVVGGRSYHSLLLKFNELRRVQHDILGLGTLRAAGRSLLALASTFLVTRCPSVWLALNKGLQATFVASAQSKRVTRRHFRWNSRHA